MTKRDLLAVALKVLGLICLVYAVLDIASVLIWFDMAAMPKGMMQPSRMILNAILQILLIAGLGLAFLIYAEPMACKLVQDDVTIPPLGNAAWEIPVLTLASRTIGLVLLAYGLSDLAGIAATRAQTVYGDVIGEWKWHEWSTLTKGILQVLIGGYLLSGAYHLIGCVFSVGSRRQSANSVSEGGAPKDA